MLDFYSCGFLSLLMFCLAVWSCLLLWTCLKHHTLIFYPIFFVATHHFPTQTVVLSTMTCSQYISFLSLPIIYLVSINLSFHLLHLGLTCIVWSLYHIPYLSYPIDMMEKSSLVCVLLCFINTCVWRSKVILVLFLRYCLPCSVEKWSFARLEPWNFQKISFYNGTLAFQKELWVKSLLCKLPVALTGQQASRIHYSYLPPPHPQVLGLQVCIINPPISSENAGAQTQSSCL